MNYYVSGQKKITPWSRFRNDEREILQGPTNLIYTGFKEEPFQGKTLTIFLTQPEAEIRDKPQLFNW